MITVILSGIVSFVSTNIDDIFILLFLFSQTTNFKERLKVVSGQYLGISFLLIVSILGAYGSNIFLTDYLWLLGFLPIILGIRMFVEKQDSNENDLSYHNSLISIIILTVSNGGDNVGVYIPLFTQYNYLELVVMILIYLIMIGILCLVSYLIIKNKYVNKGIKKYQALIVPIVLILIGVMIIIKNRG